MENFLQLYNLFYFLVEGHGLKPDPDQQQWIKMTKPRRIPLFCKQLTGSESLLSHMFPSQRSDNNCIHMWEIQTEEWWLILMDPLGVKWPENGQVLRPEKISFIHRQVLKVFNFNYCTVQWVTSIVLSYQVLGYLHICGGGWREPQRDFLNCSMTWAGS